MRRALLVLGLSELSVLFPLVSGPRAESVLIPGASWSIPIAEQARPIGVLPGGRCRPTGTGRHADGRADCVRLDAVGCGILTQQYAMLRHDRRRSECR